MQLEDESDRVAAEDRRRAQRTDIGVADEHASAGRAVERPDQLQQRRLARPGWTGDRDHFARLDLEADPMEDLDRAVEERDTRSPVP